MVHNDALLYVTDRKTTAQTIAVALATAAESDE